MRKMLEESGVVSPDHVDLSHLSIPKTYRGFYQDFGGIYSESEHDENGFPVRIPELAWYQYKFAELDWGFCMKCNKVGMTTSELLGDFFAMLQPRNAGHTCLFQASNDRIAIDLLGKLYVLILNNPKYSQFIHPDTSRTKLVIRNPYNPKMPSDITAIGQGTANVYSRQKIKRVHITDPAFVTMVQHQNDFFGGLFMRLANSGGQMKIEGVPGKTKAGWFWQMCRVLYDIDDAMSENKTLAESFAQIESDFEVPATVKDVFTTMKVTIDDAVTAGIIPETQRERLRMTLPPEQYKRLCMAEWAENEGAIFRGNFEESERAAGW